MTKTSSFLIIILLSPLLIFGQSLEAKFQKGLDSLFQQNEDAIGAIIHVEFPDKNISWTSVVGFSDKEKRTVLDQDQPVLIASNTKTYVAASIIRLIEMNHFKLEDKLEKLLSSKTLQLLKTTGYDVNKITVKHLLSHTSGIHDYVDDAYFEEVKKQPKRQWKKQEQIELSMSKGKPLVEAGEKFSYGDINYLLLTEIIEKVTEKSFYLAMRELLLFDELKITNTWFKDLEPMPNGTKPMAHQYAAKYNWDSYEINPSWDLYGGGGLASTAKESALFYQYLFEGKIIKDEKLLESMSTYVLPEAESKYCLGMFHFDFTTDLFYHGGWWGTDVAYSPEANASVAMFTLEKEKRGLFAKYSKELLESLAEMSRDTVKVITSVNYELHQVENSEALLVLFPGGGMTSKETKADFDILSVAAKNNISVMLMNINGHLWVDENDTRLITDLMDQAVREHAVNTDKVYIGGMSIGGNVSLTVSNHLYRINSRLAPQGVFIVDSPIDLYALYESSQKDIANPNFSEERLAEPKWIVNYFEESFGKESNLLENIQKVSPFTLKANKNSVPLLQNTKLRMYTEPDAAWWKENRQTDFESTNAFVIQELTKQLKTNKWNHLELIETQNKGYRSNGERHPHSWSIVNVADLIDWIKE